MTGRQHSNNSRWQQVILLGEKLLSHVHSAVPGIEAVQTAILAQRNLILETTHQLTGGQATLWLSDRLLPGFAAKLPFEQLPDGEKLFSPEPASALMRRALESRRLCWHAENEEEAPANTWGLAAPLLVKGDDTESVVLGILQSERPKGLPFRAEEVELFKGLAVQASIALQADRQMATERWRIEQLLLVRQVSEQIADVRDLDELSRQVAQLILHSFDYYYVAIFTLEPGQDMLRFRASAGPGRKIAGLNSGEEREELSLSFNIHLGEGIIGYVAMSGQEMLAGDVNYEPRYRHIDALPETRSEAALPLKIEDRVLGVLDVQSNQPDDFQETDLLVLRALAGNIANAVEGARLISALHHRAEQLSAISEVSNAITSILDQDELLDEVVTLIHKRFGYPFVHLFTVHPGRRKIFYEAGSGSRSRVFREQRFSYNLDDTHGIIPWVARHGETVLANNVESEPRYRPSPLPPDDTQAELTVPLVFGGEVLGILDVQSDQENAFGEEDRFLFEALADNVAIAMRNAFLYRSERWRRQVADSMREVAGLLSTDADLDQVLDAILTELERTIPSELAAIWLLDEGMKGNSEDGISEEDVPRLRLASVHGAEAAGLELELGLTLEEMLALHGVALDQPKNITSWLNEALNANHPVIRAPNSAFEPLGVILQFPPDYSAIATPLRVGEQSLGVLTLAHPEAGRFGTEARAMTAAFASYAAVAIENTRLYEAAHEQAWVSTVLLQVSDATQSLTNLNELLATVVRITPMLVGVKACALYILDEDDAFVPAAASGLNSEQQAEFERWRFAPGDVPAMDQVLIAKEPLILHADAEEPRLSGILLAGQEENQRLVKDELLVLVPMQARGEVSGVFLIDYSNDHPGDNNLDVLFDERLAIIQGIAHQTAIAVENIRLLKAQKEEAYVSIALLQVAQAVVSSNDLDEILGAIVRITPILVGVARTVIYLWDSEESVFRLSQAYGIPRNIEGPSYAPGEFPLLDAVRQQDRLVTSSLTFEVIEENRLPDAWATLVPAKPEEEEEYLEEEPHLLLAFPLSVKGEVLGVMLVEEPDPLNIENLASGSANKRLREKRIEIITGISQQAALAIQNDRLQLEMLERERLEREMQLAREIQRAFLPHQLPVLPGWELEVRWRTAREVGGDFYDIFELPNGRLGLVVADVADKGMPAALFMTLTRTLVRASVQGVDSPSEVLARVNDVLTPDAQQGMFVTLIYAILEPETGKLTYANAGHNPPLLLRDRTLEIERLEKGGMALGVLEGNRVVARSVFIEAGDCLIFYTDGVSEAFSPDGKMYGENYLHKTTREAVEHSGNETTSARHILDAIDASISDFTQHLPLSDDLTLLALKRMKG